jgi:hypothetical protein
MLCGVPGRRGDRVFGHYERQNDDRTLELALFGIVEHHLRWPSVSAISSRAALLRYWDPYGGQEATRRSGLIVLRHKL